MTTSPSIPRSQCRNDVRQLEELIGRRGRVRAGVARVDLRQGAAAIVAWLADLGGCRCGRSGPDIRESIHLFVLWSFAVAQPLYDLIGSNAEFLVAHGAGVTDLLALVVLLSLAPPLVLVLAEAAIGFISLPPDAGSTGSSLRCSSP